ncbi:MAG: InlB B-repeat-containing protein [Bacilli bacterium]|nr:InlB B-repeat-containing protein [Bacilli bacterium]
MKKKLFGLVLASILTFGGLAACDEENEQGGEVSTKCETHVWDEGVVTTEPTTEAEGVKTYTCTVCKETKTESIPKITKEKTFRVTYDANGGTGTGLVDLNEYKAGERVTVKDNIFTAPEGKEFINWNEEADASGRYYNVGTNFKIFEDVTLYAQWLEKETIVGDDHEFDITVNTPEGVSATLSKNKAKVGDEVTLTLSLADGVTLNGNPVSSQVVLTKTGENKFTFTMPKSVVKINVRTTIDGDVVLTGDISAKLKDDDNDGIFSADVVCTSQTSYQFSYVVKDSNGNANKLSSTKLDETKCNAAVTFSTSGTNSLAIKGGYTYTFYYDSNLTDYNCYVVRKTVDVLPTTSAGLYGLFEGSMRSNSAVHPQGLTSIAYTKTVDGNDAEQGYKVTNTEYTYKKISDTESFAVAVDKTNGDKKSYVYKNIDTVTDVYSIINTYTKDEGNNEASDNVWSLDPYGNLNADAQRYFPYSAKMDIVGNKNYRETSRYQITEREAYRNINMAAHYGSALEYEIWQAIRGDYDGTATINAANKEGSHLSIKPTTLGGGFQVVLDGQLEYNHEESGSTADVTQQYAHVYNATFIFKTNGDLYSLDFTENYYTKNAWDFAKHAPKAGGTPVRIKIDVQYKYDETFERDAVLDGFVPGQYFITSIDKLSFYNAAAGTKDPNVSVVNFDDEIKIIPYLEGGKKSAIVDEFSYSPAGALDAWQYGYVDSSDKGVIDDTPWGPKAVGTGTATVTFGNHLKNITGPSKQVTMTVNANGTFRSLFVNNNISGYDSYNGPHADYIYGYAGKTMNYYIDSSQNTGCPVSYYMVIKGTNKFGGTTYNSTSEYFNVVNSVGTVADNDVVGVNCAKVVGHELVLDFNTEAANALTKQVTIDVIFMSDFYSVGNGPTTLHIVVGPAQAPLVNNKYSVTIPYENDASKVYEVATLEFFTGGTGKIVETLYSEAGAVSYINTYEFRYKENNNGTVDCTVTSVNITEPGMPKTASSYTLMMERQLDGRVGVCLYTEDLDIFGYTTEDGDGYFSVEGLTAFEKVDA